MKIKIKIEDHTYDVEVGDITQRPVTVLVDGELFSVWPEENLVAETEKRGPVLPVVQPAVKETETQLSQATKPTQEAEHAPTKLSSSVRAPIPGVITAIAVRQGDKIAVGDELCKLEAMKMNNSIRANRTGIIGAIHVNVGQQVKHGDILIEFGEG